MRRFRFWLGMALVIVPPSVFVVYQEWPHHSADAALERMQVCAVYLGLALPLLIPGYFLAVCNSGKKNPLALCDQK